MTETECLLRGTNWTCDSRRWATWHGNQTWSGTGSTAVCLLIAVWAPPAPQALDAVCWSVAVTWVAVCHRQSR